jgi:hypothetical protein
MPLRVYEFNSIFNRYILYIFTPFRYKHTKVKMYFIIFSELFLTEFFLEAFFN